MIQIINILFVLLAVVVGIYGVLVNQQLRLKYNFSYITSFYFYQILWLFFGLYGILGNMLIRKILLKLDVALYGIEFVSQIIPFIGVPFLIIAWYMQIKMMGEITHKSKIPLITIVYFSLLIGAFLVYGFIMNRMPDLIIEKKQNFYLGLSFIDVLINAFLCLGLLWWKLKKEPKANVFLHRFAIALIALAIMRFASLYFSSYLDIIGLYFLILFFSGNLVLILLIRINIATTSQPTKKEYNILIEQNLFEQYGISPREKEIVEEICKGKTNQQIADTLFINLQTVKDHCSNIYRKTAVKNRVQLAQLFS